MSVLDTIRRKKFMVKDGLPVSVMRPRDPAFNLEEAHKLIGVEENRGKEFQYLLHKQEFLFVGWAARRQPVILDREGKILEPMRDGDSLVTSPQMVPTCFESSHEVQAVRRFFENGQVKNSGS